MTLIYHSNVLLYNEELTFLTDLSPSEVSWDEHRATAEDMAVLYNRNLEFTKYADRINGCSGYLKFGVDVNNGKKLVLKEVWFCRVRHCPVCQWRRSLRIRAMVYQNIEKIMSEYSSHRWIFLTLTVKNPHVTDLRSTIDDMNKGWKRLIQSKRFKGVVDGFIRTTEITRPRKKGQEMDAHPHFHAMLLVKSTYFNRDYIKQSEWVEMWIKAMRLDYLPQVNVQAVKPNKRKTQEQNQAALHNAILETFKYSVKPSDMLAHDDQGEWLCEITRQTHRLRFISDGGVLKGLLKPEDEMSNQEMISTSEEQVETDETRFGFSYLPTHRRYVYNPKFNVYPETA